MTEQKPEKTRKNGKKTQKHQVGWVFSKKTGFLPTLMNDQVDHESYNFHHQPFITWGEEERGDGKSVTSLYSTI